MVTRTGLKPQKFDLHVHTPASHDFTDKQATADDIVTKAIAQGLRGIAVTDHNTGAMIDQLKEAAMDTELVVFPGVEIYCTGGKTGIHVIGILDPQKGRTHVEALLSKLNIEPEDWGKKKAATEKSVYDVVDAISDSNGIAILAHCTSSKGVLHDIAGETRTKIFTHKGLLAVETSQHDFCDDTKQQNKTRAVDCLDGTNENYNKRELGVVLVSDAHRLDDIGKSYTYLKVDDDVDLESLRQCFIDPLVRIRQCFEIEASLYPYVKSVAVEGGFFDNERAELHPGLNSILGAKGAGKSLLLELIRFALGQPSTQPDILEDHNRKLEKRLNTYGKVRLTIVDENGESFQIERQYNPADGNPYGNEEQEQLAQAFTVLALSQNEIVKIAESPEEQMKFIDRFFDFQHYQNRIKNLEADLETLDKRFADGLRAMHLQKDIDKQLSKNKAELKKITEKLKDTIFSKYQVQEQKHRLLKLQTHNIDTLIQELEKQALSVDAIPFVELEGIWKEDPVLRRNDDRLKAAKKKAVGALNVAVDEIRILLREVESEYKNWSNAFEKEKKAYEEHVRAAGGDRKSLELQRLKINKEVDNLDSRKAKVAAQVEGLRALRDQRDESMKQLFSVYEEYSNERRRKCEKFEDESAGRLQLRIHEQSNVDEFRERLQDMKRGSYLRDMDIDEICDDVTPNEFIMQLLRYQVNKDRGKLEEVSDKSGVDIEKLCTLCDFLLSEVSYEDLLRLQYRAFPQDRPEIKVRVTDVGQVDKYELISDVSVGQKCTAMLIMALSDGTVPIVIDQPEDSLDIRSIWADMCTKVRKGKEGRQFIFTTHNSCLAVASDTDKYTVVEGDAVSGRIVMCGALESLKPEVIKYLEGGRDTYDKKSGKYGLR